MPLYDYVCRRCGQHVEAMAPMGKAGQSKRHADGCGGLMARCITAPFVHFIESRNGGSGWSQNGYRSYPEDFVIHEGQRRTFPGKPNKQIGKSIG